MYVRDEHFGPFQFSFLRSLLEATSREETFIFPSRAAYTQFLSLALKSRWTETTSLSSTE